MISNNDEERIKKAFQTKDWPQVRVTDSWQIFKIMAEFVDGFETLSRIGPCVSVFGSARTKPDHPYYKMAEEVSAKLAQAGFGVITGEVPALWKRQTKAPNPLAENL